MDRLQQIADPVRKPASVWHALSPQQALQACGVDAARGLDAAAVARRSAAQWRGDNEISLGAVLGSNIFNGLFIIGTAATIHPIAVAWRDVALALGFGVVALLAAYPERGGRIGRWRAAPLLGLYALYVLAIWRSGGHAP